MNTNELLQQLRQPFPPDAISWLPGATTKDKSKCMAMAYGDLRAYMERLDDVCGMDWAVRYVFWGDKRLACELTISGVTRSSTGEYEAQDEKNNIAGTVAEAQAFKRACAMFGLGRYLYELPSAWVSFDATASKISKEGQNELDKRYRDWYQRTIAAAAKRSAPVTQPPQAERQACPVGIDAETGEIVDGDVLFAKDEPQGSPPHQRLFGQLTSGFGKDAEAVRPWLIGKWTEKVTPDNTRNSATELSDTEKDILADYIRDNLAVLQRVWKNHKAGLQQATDNKVAA